jgi:6-phosphogluconolactonase
VPGDPLLAEREHLLGLTGLYQGTTRMSLTFPVLDQAAERLWLVTGADKPEALARLLAADPTIPAGCVRRSGIVMADAAAAALVRA